jgi:hypothetical protein
METTFAISPRNARIIALVADVDVLFLDRPVADRQGRADRSLGVVLVSLRSAEDGHDRVADELLHRAAVTLELRAQRP